MSNYTPATNFAAKDALTTGNPAKIVKGTEISAEFNAISTAVNSKIDTTKFPNVSTAVTKTSAELNKVQTQDGTETWLTVSGTNTITATATPTVAAYATGQTFRFLPAASNTGAVTINVDGVGAKAITKSGSTALTAGDLSAGVSVQVTYDGTQFQLISGAGGGAVAGGVFYENSKTLTSNYTLSSGKNALMAGPLTVASGVTLTVPSGQRLVVL